MNAQARFLLRAADAAHHCCFYFPLFFSLFSLSLSLSLSLSFGAEDFANNLNTPSLLEATLFRGLFFVSKKFLRIVIEMLYYEKVQLRVYTRLLNINAITLQSSKIGNNFLNKISRTYVYLVYYIITCTFSVLNITYESAHAKRNLISI